MAPSESTTSMRGGKCAFAILVPFAIAMATILSSTIMTNVSEDQATESHRLEREAIWDIPVMDTLQYWKRSMGTVGSGKLKLEAVYENGDIQHYNTTERYYEKILENTTRVYDEVNNVWLNVTKNYTVAGNWTRTVSNDVTIAGNGQATDSAITPDGLFFYVVTGYFSATTTHGGYACTTAANNDCLNQKGYITAFKRDPTDGTLLWKSTLRLGVVSLQKIIISNDGLFIYVIEYDTGIIYTLSRDSSTGEVTLLDTITECSSGSQAACEDVGSSRFIAGAMDLIQSHDSKSIYIAVHTKKRILQYSRDSTSGLLSYVKSYSPAARFWTSLAIDNNDEFLYAGCITSSSKSANTGEIYMYVRNTTDGTLTLLDDTGISQSSLGWTVDNLRSGVLDTVNNPYENTARMRFPRAMVVDSSNEYMYVASYSNSRVLAFVRDTTTGMIYYKTSAQNYEDYLTTADQFGGSQSLTSLKYPISLVLSGDGGTLYAASDGSDNVAVINIETVTASPTSVPTAGPTIDSYPMQDPLSYADNMSCTTACKVLWPDIGDADNADSRFDSANVCGGSCFSSSGYCGLLSSACAGNTEVVMDGDVNATVVESDGETWTEANDFCEVGGDNGGARLCTVDEIAFDETEGSGCWSEDDLLWSSTACVDNTTGIAGYFAIASSARYPTTEGVCLPDNSTATVVRTRCCADVQCGGATPSPTLTFAPTSLAATPLPTPSPSIMPNSAPTNQPTVSGYDLKMTFIEDYTDAFTLNQPNGLIVSPDWYSLYVVGTESNTIVSLKRNATTPNPTGAPTFPPTPVPSPVPTPVPTALPTIPPTPVPTYLPTNPPTPVPTPLPTAQPTPLPTSQPTPTPTTPEPSSVPTPIPTPSPTHEPSPLPTPRPTPVPIPLPTPKPTPKPSIEPTRAPTPRPTKSPTPLPTGDPTHAPTPSPTTPEPTGLPTPSPTAIPQYYIKSMNNSEWCWTLPKADTPSGYRNGLVPILARCVSSKSQRWSFDIQLKQIHPQNEYSWCLDSDFDKGVRRPMTVFRCGKTFSQKAATNHQQWDWSFPDSGTLTNVGTKRCAATGKLIYQGRYIQSWFCDDTNQDWDFVAVN